MTKTLTLLDTHPHLAQEWNDERDITEFTKGSDYKASWVCLQDPSHTWITSVSYRVKGYGDCLACKSIAFLHPEIVEEWDYEKNTVSPWAIRTGSGKKVWWIGKECQHSWEMELRARIRSGYNCPYCSGQRVLPGFNDLMTTHPDLAKQWDEEKNDKTVFEVSYGLKKKVWWTDDCGHSWEMSPLHRTKLKDSSCIVCRSVGIVSPEILKEWDDEKDPYIISNRSSVKVSWKCPESKSHKWKATIHDRTIQGQGCPYCVGRKVISGESDVATTHPHLVEEWDDERGIHEFSFGSNYKAQWKCKKNPEHIWLANILSRSSGKWNCPYCPSSVSQAEQEITDHVSELGFSSSRNRKILNGKELDIYIPEKKIAFEYNGIYWHGEHRGKDKWYHYNKWNECKKKGIQLITIWEDDYKTSPDLIKTMISHKLGKSNNKKIPARKTETVFVDIDNAKVFYSKNHIQGFKSGTHIGLVLKKSGELVAISTWSKNKKNIYLDRFATSEIVQGGFSKLLKFAVKKYKAEGFERITTFAAHDVSDGGLYENNGFIKDKELSPDYFYIHKNQRKHKFGFRLKRFRNDPDLKYVEGYTEKQLADINSLPRIWDCGKTRYILTL